MNIVQDEIKKIRLAYKNEKRRASQLQERLDLARQDSEDLK